MTMHGNWFIATRTCRLLLAVKRHRQQTTQTVVTLTMLPETKGASLEEINAEHEQASPPRQAVAA
jgi:hypothetical protein